jgi:arylsulfatase A
MCLYTKNIYMIKLITPTVLAIFIALTSCNNTTDTTPPLPNVVIIFADDMGYGDPGCFGGENPTPNIDQMAKKGMRFTDFYVAQPVCGASRAALLTGCYPNRVGIYGAPGPNSKTGLNSNEMTIAELLKQKDYATAMFGKWHLGHHKEFLPVHQGFDEYLGTPYSNDMWPKHPDYAQMPKKVAERKWGFPELPIIGDDTIAIAEVTGEHQAQFTTMFTERAVGFIEKNQDKPFFVYLAHPMPHVPIFASEKHLGKSGEGLYGDVIMEIDWSVGRINHVLDSLGLAENTLVIFTSDNGPWLSYGNHAGSAGPLREGKGTAWDGGVREPCVMSWPGTIPEGSICQEPAMTIDILPTLAHLTGATLPEHKIDGLNIWPLIVGEDGAKSPQEAYYFYWLHDLHAVRSGDWKMHFPHKYRTMKGMTLGVDGMPGNYSQDSVGYVLYNLREDIGETIDLSAKYPEKLEEMKALGEKMMLELGQGKTEGTGVREVGHLEL